MTNEVIRHDLKQCTACKGTGKQTVYKEATWESAPCLTCLGEGYVVAPAPEDKPTAGMIELLTIANQELVAHKDVITRMESELAAARAEIAALKVGLLDIEAWAQKSYVVSTAAHRIITEKVSALLNRKGDD